MGNKISSSLREKFRYHDSTSTRERSGRKRKRGEGSNESDEDTDSNSGRETPPPGTSQGLAPQSDIHTPKRKKILSTSKYIYQTLFLDGENSDITILALGKKWKLHKVYLSQSPFFACMFNGSWREAFQTEIVVDIPDPTIDKCAFRTTLGSLYRDYVFIKPVDVVGVFAAASLLQLEGLIQQCLALMSSSISADTVCSFYHASCKYNISNIKMECFNWLLTNLLTTADVELLKQISIPLMKELVLAPELFVMQVEMDVYSLLKKWMFLQLNKSWGGDDKVLFEDVDTYYKSMTSDTVFLDTEEGRQFIPAFLGLRWQHVLTDLTSYKVLVKDKIINIDWLNEVFHQLWRQMLYVEQGADTGPEAVPEIPVFSKSSLRCGRVLRKKGEYCWRWVGYHYGIDLLLTYTNGVITIKRNTLSQSSPCSVSLQSVRNIVYRLRIATIDKQGKITHLKTTGVQVKGLKKDEEVTLMTLESHFSFPLLLSMDLMLQSPDVLPPIVGSINIPSNRDSRTMASQTDVLQTNNTSSQTDSIYSHVTNVSGVEAGINDQLGSGSRLKNQSFKLTTVADPPNSEKLSKSDPELIQERCDLFSTPLPGSPDNG